MKPQTPNGVSLSELNRPAAQPPSSCDSDSGEPEVGDPSNGISRFQVPVDGEAEVSVLFASGASRTGPDSGSDGRGDGYRPGGGAERDDFSGAPPSNAASGASAGIVGSAPSDDDGGNRRPHPSAARQAETSANAHAALANQSTEYDFLKVSSGRKRRFKSTAVLAGTQMWISLDACKEWAEEILAKGWYSAADIEALVAQCEGNGDPEELSINLQRNLEAEGLAFVDRDSEDDAGLWDSASNVTPDELVEALEAALTRSIRLPATQLFKMSKLAEAHMLQSLAEARRDLNLAILSSKTVVDAIRGVLDGVHDGSKKPASVSSRSLFNSQPDNTGVMEFADAADVLKAWCANGKPMEGKPLRDVFEALYTLILDPEINGEIAKVFKREQASNEDAVCFDNLIAAVDAAADKIISECLPYARRFSSRNVDEGEDPEEVFQIMFVGLARSIWRFDSERGARFTAYCVFWMRHALVRWRKDECGVVRLPVHRRERLEKLEKATNSLRVRAGGAFSDDDLAAEMGWSVKKLRTFRVIPREAVFPETADEWDDLLPVSKQVDFLEQTENRRIAMEILSDLREKDANVLMMRFGIECDSAMTLEEIGQIYGLTRERIRQIEARGFEKLSRPDRLRRLRKLMAM